MPRLADGWRREPQFVNEYNSAYCGHCRGRHHVAAWRSMAVRESSITSVVGPTAAPYMSISTKSSAGHTEALSAGVIAGISVAGSFVLILAGIASWFMSRSHTLKQALHRERKATEEVVNSFNARHSTQNLDLHTSLDGAPFRSFGLADQGGLGDSRRWSGPSGGVHGTSYRSLEDTSCRGPGVRSPSSPMTLGTVCVSWRRNQLPYLRLLVMSLRGRRWAVRILMMFVCQKMASNVVGGIKYI